MVLMKHLCYVGSCHHSMAQPQVVDGGDGLQMWKVAVNMLNKHFHTLRNRHFCT